MGLACIKNLPDVRDGMLGIWELTDTSDSLRHNFHLTQTELQELGSITNEKRKREYLSVRLLLKEMHKERSEICYNPSGKPYLSGLGCHLSIAHSQDIAVIVLTRENAGIDVENLTRNTDKIAGRFLSQAELADIACTSDPQLYRIIYWSAKEAAYKYACMEGLEFKNHIMIQPFEVSAQGGHFNGFVTQNHIQMNIFFSYFFYKNNIVVYCFEAKS